MAKGKRRTADFETITQSEECYASRLVTHAFSGDALYAAAIMIVLFRRSTYFWSIFTGR